jgi:hypothetical protein
MPPRKTPGNARQAAFFNDVPLTKETESILKAKFAATELVMDDLIDLLGDDAGDMEEILKEYGVKTIEIRRITKYLKSLNDSEEKEQRVKPASSSLSPTKGKGKEKEFEMEGNMDDIFASDDEDDDSGEIDFDNPHHVKSFDAAVIMAIENERVVSQNLQKSKKNPSGKLIGKVEGREPPKRGMWIRSFASTNKVIDGKECVVSRVKDERTICFYIFDPEIIMSQRRPKSSFTLENLKEYEISMTSRWILLNLNQIVDIKHKNAYTFPHGDELGSINHPTSPYWHAIIACYDKNKKIKGGADAVQNQLGQEIRPGSDKVKILSTKAAKKATAKKAAAEQKQARGRSGSGSFTKVGKRVRNDSSDDNSSNSDDSDSDSDAKRSPKGPDTRKKMRAEQWWDQSSPVGSSPPSISTMHGNGNGNEDAASSAKNPDTLRTTEGTLFKVTFNRPENAYKSHWRDALARCQADHFRDPRDPPVVEAGEVRA